MSELLTIVNDAFVPASQAVLAVNDLAIQRGYGVFDFFKTVNHHPIFLEDHLSRLFRSAANLRLEINKTQEQLRIQLFELMEKNNLADSGGAFTITGGSSVDGYSITAPQLIVSQQELRWDHSLGQDGISLITLSPSPAAADSQVDRLSHGDMDSAAAEGAWRRCVLYEYDGIISECPRSNFFIITRDGKLVTRARNVLPGITRKHLLMMAGEWCAIPGERYQRC